MDQELNIVAVAFFRLLGPLQSSPRHACAKGGVATDVALDAPEEDVQSVSSGVDDASQMKRG